MSKNLIDLLDIMGRCLIEQNLNTICCGLQRVTGQEGGRPDGISNEHLKSRCTSPVLDSFIQKIPKN